MNYDEDTHVQQIVQIADNTYFLIQNLRQISDYNTSIYTHVLDLVDQDKECNKEILQELSNERYSPTLVDQKENDSEIALKASEMKLLEEKETDLEAQIDKFSQKLAKLELFRENLASSDNRQKHIICRNFAKVSKILTQTSFEYQGPNVSGLITGKNIQVFDLNPSQSRRHTISAQLWEHLRAASGTDWNDIFDI